MLARRCAICFHVCPDNVSTTCKHMRPFPTVSRRLPQELDPEIRYCSRRHPMQTIRIGIPDFSLLTQPRELRQMSGKRILPRTYVHRLWISCETHQVHHPDVRKGIFLYCPTRHRDSMPEILPIFRIQEQQCRTEERGEGSSDIGHVPFLGRAGQSTQELTNGFTLIFRLAKVAQYFARE